MAKMDEVILGNFGEEYVNGGVLLRLSVEPYSGT